MSGRYYWYIIDVEINAQEGEIRGSSVKGKLVLEVQVGLDSDSSIHYFNNNAMLIVLLLMILYYH